MSRILYLHRDPPFARFIKDDLAILREEHEVTAVHLEKRPRSFAALVSAAARADLTYFWWGDVTGVLGVLLAQLRRRPSIMVTGGYDVANVPEIRYGLRYHPLKRCLPPLALELSTRIIANTHFARDGVLADFSVDPKKIVTLYHGIDPRSLPAGQGPKERRVLTCSLLSMPYIAYKGLETFVRAARHFPDVPFVHVGPHKDDGALAHLRRLAPPNVEFRGFLSEAELVSEMQHAQVYAQLSAHEGFGLALAEAMLAGATPAVSRSGAIPEVVGPVGEYADYGDVEGTVAAIGRALASPRPEAARQRIVDNFSLEARRRGLLALVAETLTAAGRS